VLNGGLTECYCSGRRYGIVINLIIFVGILPRQLIEALRKPELHVIYLRVLMITSQKKISEKRYTK